MPVEPSAMLSTRWVYTLVSCSVRLISIFLLINPGYLFIYCRCSRTPLSRIIFLYFVVIHSWPAAMSAICIWTYRMRKDYALVIRYILSCPILCPDFYPHVYGTTAVCQFVMLSCSSCQKECTNCQALANRHWLEVCIWTRRVVTLVYDSVTFEFWWSSSSITTKTGGWCGYDVLEPKRLGKMSKLLQPSRHRFWKDRLGNTGDSSWTRHGAFPPMFRWRTLRVGYTA